MASGRRDTWLPFLISLLVATGWVAFLLVEPAAVCFAPIWLIRLLSVAISSMPLSDPLFCGCLDLDLPWVR
jgi:hypothetical protein